MTQTTKYYYCEDCGKKSIKVDSYLDSKLGISSRYFDCPDCGHRPNPNGLATVKPKPSSGLTDKTKTEL